MFLLAMRNLLQDRTRLVLSIGGTGLAMALVLFFGAVFAGATGRLTAYIDHSGANVWVSQEGVRTMHMSASALPASVTAQVEAVPGVETAEAILYASDTVRAGDRDFIAYVFGLPRSAALGRPWQIVDGTGDLKPGQVTIDRAIAAAAGIRVGDTVTVMGHSMTVAGLNAGGSSLVSSVTFLSVEDFQRIRGSADVISFVLVRAKAGEDHAELASRIADQVDGVTAQTRAAFAKEERQLALDMSGDLIRIINMAGYVTGLAVVSLTVYIGTISRRREYGVLKAIGVRNSYLYGVVGCQALLSVAAGFLVGLGVTVAASMIVARANPLLVLAVVPESVIRAGIVSLLVAGVAAVLPAGRIASIEPASAIRGG